MFPSAPYRIRPINCPGALPFSKMGALTVFDPSSVLCAKQIDLHVRSLEIKKMNVHVHVILISLCPNPLICQPPRGVMS